jgi:IclR family acetate operon transcriptional repressor
MRRTLTLIAPARQRQNPQGSAVSLPPHIVATSGKAITDTPPIQSLDRGLAILEAVAASSHPVPLKQLTDLIGIDRSSVFRLANTLRQRRFLANPKGSKDYILGPTAWRLSRRYGRNVLGMFFHHHLQELTATLGETSHFTVREGVEVFFIDHQVPSGQVVSVAGQTGEFAPLHCTAHGKALVADCDLSALRDLLGSGPLQVYTRTTMRSVTALARVCAEVRAAGFAFDDGEYIAEVRCVAAPIRDPQGEIVASVGISSPVSRLHTRAVARAAAEVKKTADAITASLAG